MILYAITVVGLRENANKEMIDERFTKENLSVEMQKTPKEVLERIRDAIKKTLLFTTP